MKNNFKKKCQQEERATNNNQIIFRITKYLLNQTKDNFIRISIASTKTTTIAIIHQSLKTTRLKEMTQ